MKVLALDVGSKTIGMAKGYQENELIFPISTLSRVSVKKDTAKLVALCKKESIGHVVIGLPLLADGSSSFIFLSGGL